MYLFLIFNDNNLTSIYVFFKPKSFVINPNIKYLNSKFNFILSLKYCRFEFKIVI